MDRAVGLTNGAYVLVRAGAAAIDGRAILLPGDRGADSVALVSALVRQGATLYADEYVPIDSEGRVHPYPSPSTAAEGFDGEPREAPAPIALIAELTHREGAGLALMERPAGDGTLMLLHHARGADRRPEFAVRAARAATRDALALAGERDDAEQAAAALIELLARVPREGLHPRPDLPPPAQFVALVLELEGELAELAGKLEEAGVDAVLLNGDEVRPALAHGFAFSFAAVLEVPGAQVPRALGAMESAAWQRMGPDGDARYFRQGMVVRIRPRRPNLARARGLDHQRLVKGRLGFVEPQVKVAEDESEGAPRPMPLDPGGALRTGPVGAVLQCAAQALTALDTLRLRTREREFHGLPVQYGPGVFGFETLTEPHVDSILAGLPEGPGVRFVDVGTGTGAVALSVAKQRPEADVLATDVSLRALGWARRNRRRLGVRNVRLAQGSLLAPVPAAWHGRVAAIAANLPISPPRLAVELSRARGWPVGTATGWGADGLGLVRALVRDARGVLAPGGHLHLHLGGDQGAWIAPYLDELGYTAEIPPDSTRRATVEVTARWPGIAPA